MSAWHTIHRDLQDDVHARLSNDAYFTDITVLLQRKGNIEADVLQALSAINEKGGKSGACCVVLMPETELPEGQNLPGPPIEIVVAVQVIEMPIVNEDPTTGTGKTAESLANVVLALLHHYAPYHLGGTMVADKKPIQPVKAEGGVIMYAVTARLRAGLQSPDKVLTPGLTDAAGIATLTCPTSGASIYYTLDGSYPGPANAAAVLYSAPFAFGAATLVRAVAYKTGLLPSDSIAADVTPV